MKQGAIFVHSAGPQYENEGSSGLLQSLKNELSEKLKISHPNMPDPETPVYIDWKERFESELMKYKQGSLVLIGHSLGGSFLLKYLSEEAINFSIDGLFIVSAPVWGIDREWQLTDFFLNEDFEKTLPSIKTIYLYHSIEEEIVPFKHHEYYAEKLPKATTRKIEGAEHLFEQGLPILIEDIRRI